MKTSVVSLTPEKEDDAKRMGASEFIRLDDTKAMSEHKHKFDMVVICGKTGDET